MCRRTNRQPYEEVDEGPDLVEIHVSETFSGDIEGTGVVRFLQAVRKDGSASFVGIERVTGSVEGRTGSRPLDHRPEHPRERRNCVRSNVCS
jgi:hypothetical protein